MAKLNEELKGAVAAAPDKTVIRIGYCGNRSRNRGLEQVIGELQAKYPNAEIVAVQIKPGDPPGKTLDAFHTGTL